MTDRMMKLVLPLFDATATVQSVMQDEESCLAGAAVAGDGVDFFVHRTSDLAQAAAQSGGDVLLRDLPGRQLGALTPHDAMEADLDPLLIDSHRHAADIRLPEGIAIASVLATPRGRRFAVTYVDTLGDMKVLVSRKWVCNPHGETYIRLAGGRCPCHEDGVLQEL
jgi:hypothetical protein